MSSPSDYLYPDNPKRERRSVELASDVTTSAGQCARYASQIKEKIENESQAIRDLLASMGREVPPIEQITLDSTWDMVFAVVHVLSPVLIYKTATSYITQAAAIRTAQNLLTAGRIGPAALQRLVPLAGRWKWGARAGGVATAVAVELVFSAIDGAIRRSELQGHINDGVQSRVRLKRVEIVNRLAYERVTSIEMLIEQMRDIGLTPDQILGAVQRQVEKFKAEVDRLSDKTAADELAALDHARDSWTNEDPAISRSATPGFTTMPVDDPVEEHPLQNISHQEVSTLAHASHTFNVVLKAADGRYVTVVRERVVWVCAGTRNFEEAVQFKATVIEDECIQLQYCPEGEQWNRYLYPDTPGSAGDGSKDSIWANRQSPDGATHFKIEKVAGGGVKIRAANGKLLVPRQKGQYPGHLEANAAEDDPAAVFRLIMICDL